MGDPPKLTEIERDVLFALRDCVTDDAVLAGNDKAALKRRLRAINRVARMAIDAALVRKLRP